MSKSEESEDSYILLQDAPETVVKKFKRAVTDSDTLVKFDTETKPAISNLLVIFSGFTERPIEEIAAEYENAGYGKFKTDVGEVVAQKLGTYQKDFKRYRDDEAYLMEVVKEGNTRANEIANKKIKEVYDKLGLIYK
jgi:tryptophanyl-tRNA synthetase